jgi:hypothetical protein
MELKMANLSISVDKKYFKSDSIVHGRKIGDFFEQLTTNVFHQSYQYWKASRDLIGKGDLPLLYKERNLYSIFASAIDKITPIHLSEWAFNTSDYTADNSRRVDFWCLTKDGDAGKRINYFIELKKTYYCISDGTNECLTSNAEQTISGLAVQIQDLKKLGLDWEGDGNVFLGLVVIHGYYSENKEVGFNEATIRENIYKTLDKKLKFQLILTTWNLPENMDIQWKNDKCKFVTIAGIAITKHRGKL